MTRDMYNVMLNRYTELYNKAENNTATKEELEELDDIQFELDMEEQSNLGYMAEYGM